MNSYLKKIAFAVLCASCMLIAGCKQEDDQAKQTLTMATSADYPPFEYYENNRIVGFDIDLANMVAEKLGYNLKIVDMDFIGIIPALQSKKVDFAMSAINPTSQRAKNVDFSEIYYFNDASFLYIQDGINDDLLNFQNKTFGAQIGSVFEDFLHEKQKEFPSIKVHSIAKIPLLIEELKLGRVDAVLLDRQIARKLELHFAKGKTLDVSNFNFGAAVAFPKGNAELVEEFNSVLAELIHNGEIAKLKSKWLSNVSQETANDSSNKN